MRDRASAVRRALRRVPPGRAREWLRDLLLHGERGGSGATARKSDKRERIKT